MKNYKAPSVKCESPNEFFCCLIITARKRSLGQGNMFTGVCLSTGGVPGPRGEGAWSRGEVPGVDPPPDGYSCGRYASYWNAFLFLMRQEKFWLKHFQFSK